MFLLENIKNKASLLPEKSGCYLYFNSDKKVIYVGKAKNLKKRVSSYFNKVHNTKTTILVREIADIDFFITTNETEALVLERNLIKKYRPRFNVVLNDDKNYPYIVITNERDPEYKYVRSVREKYKKAYGPLPDGTSAIKILKMLQRIYPLRKCNKKTGEPCFSYHIEQCSGYCVKDVEEKYYKDMIEKIDDFFKGKTENVLNLLNNKMHNAADNLQFEEAGRIKDIIKHIYFVINKQNVELNNEKDIDVINYYVEGEQISVVTLFYIGGRLSFKDNSVFDNSINDVNSILEQYILQLYQKNKLPSKLYLPKEIINEALNEALDIKIIHGNKTLLDLAYENAKEYLVNDNITRSMRNNMIEPLNELQNTLGLDKFPFHIEMYDVANILDEYVTGVRVTFRNGQPSKNEFRKYNIDIEEKGDYHRMKNMIYRRLQKDIFEPQNLPDLIIMDGGTQQVNAANEEMHSLELNIPVIGLVKNDKHKTEKILNFNGEEIELDKKSNLFNLLQNFQDRVHNYAISSFRKRQNKEFIKK